VTERIEILHVGHQQPTRNILNLPDRPFYKCGLIVVRYFDWLPKRKDEVADNNLILVVKPNRMVQTTFI